MSEDYFDLDVVITALSPRPEPVLLLRHFRPPARFAPKRFETYVPRHPSQRLALDRLSKIPTEIGGPRRFTPSRGLFTRRRKSTGGIYVDGGFGVGKTHLLAALWNASPSPRAYLSFDELMYLIGLLGVSRAAAVMEQYRLITVDEWELDDPGNLKMALAFLRKVLAEGVFIAVTSNTLPRELGEGRFSQKDFRAEVEELAAAFEVVRLQGEDYRHRNFSNEPGSEYFIEPSRLDEIAAAAPAATIRASFSDLIAGLSRLHPIRYRDLARTAEFWIVEDVGPLVSLPDALRWVHFIDAVYDAGLPLTASGNIALKDFFGAEAMKGAYGRKLSRCLSRLQELLGERRKQKKVAVG